MKEQEVRKCGICTLPLREGSPDPRKIRIGEADIDAAEAQMTATSDLMKKAPKPGLYHACEDCFAIYAPLVEARQGFHV